MEGARLCNCLSAIVEPSGKDKYLVWTQDCTMQRAVVYVIYICGDHTQIYLL
jgi:hypothetical protein